MILTPYILYSISYTQYPIPYTLYLYSYTFILIPLFLYHHTPYLYSLYPIPLFLYPIPLRLHPHTTPPTPSTPHTNPYPTPYTPTHCTPCMATKNKEIFKILSTPPPLLQKPSSHFSFGTAGYRAPASTLHRVLSRASLVAYIRTATFFGKTVGIAITASHNPPADNGIKLIDHNGDMMDDAWERLCDEVVNCEDRELYGLLNRAHIKHGNLREIGDGSIGHVAVGRDTRASGEELCRVVKEALRMVGCRVSDYGEVTTPELHFLVRRSNQEGRVVGKEEYVEHLAGKYRELLVLSKCSPERMCIDTANGVARQKLEAMALGECFEFVNGVERGGVEESGVEESGVEGAGEGAGGAVDGAGDAVGAVDGAGAVGASTGQTGASDHTHTHASDHTHTLASTTQHSTQHSTHTATQHPTQHPTHSATLLNTGCGAEYVVKTGCAPQGFTAKEGVLRCVSFDGDADRLVYLFNAGTLTVVNGDRLCTLLMLYLSALVDKAGLTLTLGAVLSVYSNRAAVDYLRASFPVDVANTGVKNLVRLARMYDIGVYFEPNGHGSVVFSERCLKELEACRDTSNAAKILRVLSQLFDPCVGDALANFLVFECILPSNSLENLMLKFKDLCVRQLAVKVRDKGVLRMGEGTELVEPRDLAVKINHLASKYEGRVFARPSGTEDIVRVYAECVRQDDADVLCVSVAQCVYDMCGGVGAYPEIKYE